MNRTLVIPISIAAALHLGVLFGFPRGKVPQAAKAAPSVHLKDFTIRPDEPEPEEKVLSEEKSVEPSKDLVPRSPEPPAAPTPTDFEMKTVPAVEVDARLGDLKNVDFEATTRVANLARGNLIDWDKLDNTPRARVQIAPPYPQEARTQGLDGRVLVEFVVDETGKVIEPHVVNSSNRIFEETTLRTLTRWRFEPGRKNGRAVRFRMALPVDFKLNEN